MAFVLPFLRDLKSDFGTEATHFTGDGGGKVLVDLRPTRRLRSIQAVVEYTLHRNALLPAEVACDLAGVKPSDFMDAFAECIASYPEHRGEDRNIRFLLKGRGARGSFEGEDRNRCYFWSTTPFYAFEFFRLAMAVPQSRKSGHRLYSRFLRHLGPSVADLPRAGKVPAGSAGHRLARSARRVAFRSGLIEKIYRFVRPARTYSSEHDPAVVDCLQSQVDHCEAVRDQLSADSLNALVAEPVWLSSIQLRTLLTVTSCIEVLTTGSSSLHRIEH
jgi:asparagine synthase (glutamine-hydrolysing)